MMIEYFDEQISAMRERVSVLNDYASNAQSPVMQEIFAELDTALEELQVADSELRIQNEELSTAREIVEWEREQFKELFEMAPIGYFVTNIDGAIQQVNRAGAEILGMKQDHLRGKPLILYVSENERRAFRTQLLMMQHNDPVVEWELTLFPRRSAPLRVGVTVSASRNADGEAQMLRWIIRPISQALTTLPAEREPINTVQHSKPVDTVQHSHGTKPKSGLDELLVVSERMPNSVALKTAENLEFAEAFLQAAMKDGSTAIACFDHELKFVKVNSHAASLFGSQPELLVNKPLDGRALRGLALIIKPIVSHVISSKLPMLNVSLRDPIASEDLTIRYYSVNCYPLLNAQGNILGATVMINDISNQRRLSEAIVDLEQQVEQMNERLFETIIDTHQHIKNGVQMVSAMINLSLSVHKTHVPASELQRLLVHLNAMLAVNELMVDAVSSNEEQVSTRALFAKLLPLVHLMIGQRTFAYETDDVMLPAKQGAALATVLSELIHHAAGKGDQISLKLTQNSQNVELEIRHNGEEFPEAFDTMLAADSGLELVEKLVRWTLLGSTRYENLENGARIKIAFPVETD